MICFRFGLLFHYRQDRSIYLKNSLQIQALIKPFCYSFIIHYFTLNHSNSYDKQSLSN